MFVYFLCIWRRCCEWRAVWPSKVERISAKSPSSKSHRCNDGGWNSNFQIWVKNSKTTTKSGLQMLCWAMELSVWVLLRFIFWKFHLFLQQLRRRYKQIWCRCLKIASNYRINCPNKQMNNIRKSSKSHSRFGEKSVILDRVLLCFCFFC